MIICEDKDYVEAAEFYASKLGIPEETIIGIQLHNTLNVAGYCQRHDDQAIPYYIIGLDTSKQDTIIEEEDPFMVLAHEMVHVKQYALGELVDANSYCMWKGQRYQEFEADSEEYYFSPWEVEAFGMQVGLYRLYCRSIEE